jgi:hypothetical protein
MNNDDYEIGYGRPPRHSQFKPGQSGNPKGRPKPKNSHILKDFESVFLKREEVLVNGQKEYYSGLELYLRVLKQSAMKEKNHKDRRILLELMKFLQISERYSNHYQENAEYMEDSEDI